MTANNESIDTPSGYQHDVLRLPITSIEKYHLADDRSDLPNVFACRITVSGNIDRQAADEAARITTERHRLSAARLRRGPWRRRFWVSRPQDLEQVQIDWPADGKVSSPGPRYVDLDYRAARCWAKTCEDNRTQLTWLSHHGAMDGLAGMQLIADWMVAYHQTVKKSDRPKLRRLDPGLLHHRNHLRMLSRQFVSKIWIQPIAMLGAVKFLFRSVSSVNDRPYATTENQQEDFRLQSIRVATDVTKSLAQDALHNVPATTNDVMLRAVFLGLHRYRKESGQHKMGEWLRVVVPMSIRDFSDRRLPAANRASIVQLDRTDRDFEHPAGLLWGIHYELGNVRRWQLDRTFLLIIRCMSAVPGWIARAAHKPKCRATTVITNLGAPFDRLKLPQQDGKVSFGDLVLEKVELAVPLRPYTPIGFTLMRHGPDHRLTMNYDHRQIDDTHASRILELIADELNATRS